MINDLFERYKQALRRGHVAASRGQLDDAVVAYGEAIELAPDRVLPYTGLSGVLVRLDRPAEALTVVERATERAPSDESAWRARADLLIAANRRADAADCLDRLAAILDGQGRLADACDVTREALDLAESRERRRGLEAYVKRLGAESGDATAASVVGRAEASLREPGPAGSNMAHLHGSADLLAATERAMAAGDPTAVRTTALAASAAQRRDGLFDAALDTCYLALGVAPADPAIHLALTDLYLDRGWRTAAVDKVLLLGQLADLTGDRATRDRLAAIVSARLADEPRLVPASA